ncbi:CLUMA_CG002058, isoform A [Clunio marinus]|uniref:CLUMA_CG002058, isoform A n=1 Tax=Clunio marinus TaxID=568069 RepID=A0A1J1HP76_9DIPT|nr:CLUMA_CG002058, isoform A [Clunio marinus]
MDMCRFVFLRTVLFVHDTFKQCRQIMFHVIFEQIIIASDLCNVLNSTEVTFVVKNFELQALDITTLDVYVDQGVIIHHCLHVIST